MKSSILALASCRRNLAKRCNANREPETRSLRYERLEDRVVLAVTAAPGFEFEAFATNVQPASEQGPIALAFNDQGDMFVSTGGNQKILKIPAGTNVPQEFGAVAIGDADGVTVDSENNVIVSGNPVTKFDANGNVIWQHNCSGNVQFVTVDSSDDVFVGSTLNQICKISSDGSSASAVGNFAPDSSSPRVHDGFLFVGVTDPPLGVFKATLDTGQVVDHIAPGIFALQPDFEPSTGNMFINDLLTGKVLEVSLPDETVTEVASGFSVSQGLRFDADGNLFVTDSGDKIIYKISRVANAAPTADAGGPYTIDEGETLEIDASATTDPDQDPNTLSYEWDLDGDTIFGETGAAAERGNEVGITPTFSAAGLDGPSEVIVALRVTDDNQLSDEGTATIEVGNVEPTAEAGGPYTVSEGGTIVLSGSGSDPGGSLDPLTFEWDLDGDGIFAETGTAATRGDEVGPTPTFSAVGLDGPSSVNVTLRVTDDDGGESSIAIDSPLGPRSRVVPGIELMTQEEVAEQAMLLSLAPEGWDLASYGATTQELSPATGWVGGTEWVAFGVAGGNSGGDSGNDPPNAWGYPLNAEALNNLGRRHAIFHTDDTVTRSIHNTGEPSPFGVISGLMDGNFFQLGEQHWGTFQVVAGVALSDEDTTTINITNVEPTVSTSAATPIGENGMTTLSGTITDPGTPDSFTVTIDWGDPLSPNNVEQFSLAAGTTSFTLNHQYLDDNPSGTTSDEYVINAVVTDDDQGVGNSNTSVSVQNVAPVITSFTSNSPDCGGAAHGDPVTIFADFNDTGILDTHTAIIDWGDGTVTTGLVTEAGGSGTVADSHVYTDGGIFTVTLTLSDDDLGSVVATTAAVVTGVGVHHEGTVFPLETSDQGWSGTLFTTSGGTFTPGFFTPTHNTIGGNPGGYIAFTPPAAPAMLYSIDDGPASYGDLTGQTFTFDYFISDGSLKTNGPGTPLMRPFFESEGGTFYIANANVSFDPNADGTWTTHTLDLDAANFSRLWFTGAESFATALSSVEAIGLVMWASDVDPGNVTASQNSSLGVAIDVGTPLMNFDSIGVVDTWELQIVGTDAKDQVQVSLDDDQFKVQADFNDGQVDIERFFNTAEIEEIVILLCGGEDQAQISDEVVTPALVDGGDGDDQIQAGGGDTTVFGGSGEDQIQTGDGDNFVDGGDGEDQIQTGDGADIILGGDDEDKVQANGGRDLLIGGQGEDELDGGDGQDVVIGGTTLHDSNAMALEAILNEWTASESYATRVANISGAGSGLFLNSSTVFDDEDEDKLKGGDELDWFFAQLGEDELDDLQNDEVVIDL